MAKEYSLEIVGQPYFGRNNQRTYNIYFSEPEVGINEQTGILLLVAGFNGSSNSNVYKKIRREYSDKYNMVVVQSNYMGTKYLQDIKKNPIYLKDIIFDETEWTVEEIDTFLNNRKEVVESSNGRKTLECIADTQETLDEFAEMGIFQAMDNIRAIKVVSDIISKNGYKYNQKKIVAFGDSQGAYLCYLMNRLCPTLFSAIIDNSSWIVPEYLHKERLVYAARKDVIVIVRMMYLVDKIIEDEQIYDLSYLYNGFENKAQIFSFHGKDDELVSLEAKEKFVKNVDNIYFYRVGIDIPLGEIFQNTSHSCGANYLKLLDSIFEKNTLEKEKSEPMFQESIINTEKFQYKVIMNDDEFKIERKPQNY